MDGNRSTIECTMNNLYTESFFPVFQYFIQTKLKGIGQEAIQLKSGVLSQNSFARFQYNPNWGTEVHVNPCQFALSIPHMQVALADIS